MQIEVRGPESFLEELRLNFHDQLEKNGYVKGPKVGQHETYTKRDVIISLQISEESEGRECTLHMECEQDIAELPKIWDNAVIEYAKELIRRLKSIAQDPQLVREALKSLY